MNDVSRYLRARKGVAIGLVAIVAVLVLLVADYTGALRGVFSSGGRTVVAEFRNAKTINVGDPVHVNGVTVGSVTNIISTDGARTAEVKMSVSKSAGTIYNDATASVRWRTLLGGAFYVAIDPGNPTTGPLNGPIPAKHTQAEVELDDVATVISGKPKQGLKTSIKELGTALSASQSLGQLSTELSHVAPTVATGVGALRGVTQDTDLQNLVTDADSTVKALNAPDDQLRTLVQGAATTLQTTAARSADIESTLAQAPADMDLTNATLTKLDTTLSLANPLIAKLQKPATEVAPALTKLQPVTTHASTLLNNAKPLLADLRPAVNSLAGASTKALPLLNGITPALNQLARTILPYMAAKDPQTQHSAAEMVGAGAGGLALVAAEEDQNGHYLHFPATVGSNSVYLNCASYIADPDQAQVAACEDLQTQLQQYFSYDPLSTNGSTTSTSSTSGKAGSSK